MGKICAILTTHNEGKSSAIEADGGTHEKYVDSLAEKHKGNEVRATVDSLRENTGDNLQIVIVDDGGTDGSCDGLKEDGVIVVRNEERIGIAHSRNQGVDAAPSDCDVFSFFDAHQRVDPGVIDRCADISRKYNAIVWPDVRGMQDHGWTSHGAFAAVRRQVTRKDGSSKKGDRLYFDAIYSNKIPRDPISRITAMVVPGYSMTRDVFNRVRLITTLRGWGASEPALWVKAFFLDIDILHACGMCGKNAKNNMLVRHLFRKRPHYSLPWREIYRNQAAVAKVCFDAETWERYWWPVVFDKRKLDEEGRQMLESPELIEEHLAFQCVKKRPDSEFWRGLILEPVPKELIG